MNSGDAAAPPQRSRLERLRHLVEIVAFIGAGVWAIYVFVYQERIKPTLTPPAMHASFDITHVTPRGRKEIVTIDFHLKNISAVDLELVGAYINAFGVRYTTGGKERLTTPVEGTLVADRGLTASKPALIAAFVNRWRGFGVRKSLPLEPGNEFAEHLAFAIPDGSYDLARVTWRVCWSRIDAGPWPMKLGRNPDGSYVFHGDTHDIGPNKGLICNGSRSGELHAL